MAGADDLERCIRACFECTQVFSACAAACLFEHGVEELRRCVATDLACADICARRAHCSRVRDEMDRSSICPSRPTAPHSRHALRSVSATLVTTSTAGWALRPPRDQPSSKLCISASSACWAAMISPARAMTSGLVPSSSSLSAVAMAPW